MADTANLHTLVNDRYYSVNTLFGISVGTAISIQNQTTKPMKVSVATTQPDVSDKNYILYGPYPMPPVSISSGESEVWVYGSGDINVQVL